MCIFVFWVSSGHHCKQNVFVILLQVHYVKFLIIVEHVNVVDNDAVSID